MQIAGKNWMPARGGALLPVLARFQLHLCAVGYGGLSACFGVGAFAVATFVSQLRSRASAEMTIRLATGLLAISLLVVGVSDKPMLIGVSLFVAGACWLAAVTTFNTSVQIGAAEWVRGRAMAIYLLVFFGSIAVGSAGWGFSAEHLGVRQSVISSSALLLTLVLARWSVAGCATTRPYTGTTLAYAAQSRRIWSESRSRLGDRRV